MAEELVHTATCQHTEPAEVAEVELCHDMSYRQKFLLNLPDIGSKKDYVRDCTKNRKPLLQIMPNHCICFCSGLRLLQLMASQQTYGELPRLELFEG